MEYIYAALLLHKLGQPINEDGMKKVITATGAQVDDSKLKTLMASLKDVDVGAELENANVAIASGGSVGAIAPVVDKAEEKKEEEKPAESAAGLASLFG